MKTKSDPLRSSFLVLSAAAALYGQASAVSAAEAAPPAQPVSSPKRASAGLVNDWLRDQSPAWDPWDFGGQVRLRYELKDNFGVNPNTDFLRTGFDNDNSYLLLRSKVHLGYQPVSWLGAFAEARDSNSFGDERVDEPEEDSFDLHQGYLFVGDAREFPLTLKVGRQELSYGDERLVGAFDWNNIGRVFDAAKARFQVDELWVDAFVGRVILADDNNFNMPNDYDWFSGAYASTRSLCPKQETEFYFLARNTGTGSPTANEGGRPQSGNPPPRDIYTLGLRMKSLPGQLQGWDYALEMAGQFGRFKETLGPQAGSNLDHKAFAAHLGGGYTWSNSDLTPRLGFSYSYASGDDDPEDGDHGTFENLFPTNHKFYGYMDFFSWQNIHNPQLSGSIKPLAQLKVSLDYHAFWLAETSDFFYNAAGLPRTRNGYGRSTADSNYVGSEVDLVATYTIRPYAVAQAGYGHFFTGPYLRDSLAANGATDANYVYAQMTFNF